MMSDEGRRQTLADVLAGHQPGWADHKHSGAIICSCGVVLHRAGPQAMRPWGNLWLHVADQVLSDDASRQVPPVVTAQSAAYVPPPWECQDCEWVSIDQRARLAPSLYAGFHADRTGHRVSEVPADALARLTEAVRASRGLGQSTSAPAAAEELEEQQRLGRRGLVWCANCQRLIWWFPNEQVWVHGDSKESCGLRATPADQAEEEPMKNDPSFTRDIFGPDYEPPQAAHGSLSDQTKPVRNEEEQ